MGLTSTKVNRAGSLPLLLALVLLAPGGYVAWNAVTSSRWPTVEAQVNKVWTDYEGGRGGPHYTAHFSYTYSVGNKTYTGQEEIVENFGSQKAALADLGDYRPGARTLVHYDPDHPERSVSNPGGLLVRSFGFAVMGLFAGIVLFYVFKYRLFSRHIENSG